MELTLTDRLTCPRCGPTFGLILLAHRLSDRRVRDGVLGCPNCRDSFPIRDNFVDLRAPPRGVLESGLAGSPEEDPEGVEEATRMIAMLGIPRGPGTVALVGSSARHSATLADTIENLQVVGVDADLRSWPDAPGVSRVVAAPGLPFFSLMLRGVVVDGRLGTAMVTEAGRITAPTSRVVVLRAHDGVDRVLIDAGLSILASEPGTVVAARS